MNEPIFSVLTGKGAGFIAGEDWMGASGTYCPAGTYEGANYYSNGSGWLMWRQTGYWYIHLSDGPGNFYGPPYYNLSYSSTPPLTGWFDAATASPAWPLSAGGSC
jgi:hypothetical protein